MKVVAMNGSPRGRNGSNTGKIVEALFRGMNRAGAETEQVYLSEKKIGHCRGCFACWFGTPGQCVQKDDMAELLPLLCGADLVIYATPLYVDNVTGIMKDFQDRCIPVVHPHFIDDGHGELRHPARIRRASKVMVVSCCGFIEFSQFQALDHTFQRVARNMNADIVARIYRTTGELLNGRIPEVQQQADRYFELVEQAGEAIINTGSIPAELQEQLDAPLVPGHQYIAVHNQFCNSTLGPVE